MLDADDLAIFPVDQWIADAVQWVALHLRPLFIAIKWPVENLLSFNDYTLHEIPFPIFVVLVSLTAYRLASIGIAVFSAISLVVIAAIGVWTEAMTTLSLITTAIVFCTAIGVPTGIWCARNDKVWSVVRPVLDIMQTTPTFVYLVPVVMLFGVGTVPGEVAVVTAAAPPLIRFTNLGIRMVEQEMVEAGLAFGADKRQLLWEIQLPLAIPTILGGLNQTVLTAMVMSVVVAMIGAEGLGLVVLQGLGRLDVGRAAVGGIAIVLLAMMLDRITQQLAQPTDRKRRSVLHYLFNLFKGERSHEAIVTTAANRTH
ncbi:proline/glycine betaine ABC transporter permease [Mesorhizobium sp.]|uniref:ABC transporter permease n=1 Tax=Mesorhizobium sp. TaxID=1871066 RepID=UPI000FD52D6E|nr:proline/glycine betaine ABC transporter permease [Mesorhizobium sp.]RVC59258.1 proline/glycine betaine ABC transporter permease [Mesorhizobium sp. M4B.F.Ca.ET.088.02.2.1]RWF33436.1 MAG: proline/glycine betaine ABC transporter permease [Mesorhizobium sp.]TIX41171.1 MAG: proline/glycine betaine ABC transporter permease [Mesorhizobium sp.]TJW02318.1 MAG: proline/glycine betaine ABC transporter permease [Mesorhizobium sp.]